LHYLKIACLVIIRFNIQDNEMKKLLVASTPPVHVIHNLEVAHPSVAIVPPISHISVATPALVSTKGNIVTTALHSVSQVSPAIDAPSQSPKISSISPNHTNTSAISSSK